MEEKELEQLDYELARYYCIANNIEDDKKDVACVAFQAGRCSGREDCKEEMVEKACKEFKFFLDRLVEKDLEALNPDVLKDDVKVWYEDFRELIGK